MNCRVFLSCPQTLPVRLSVALRVNIKEFVAENRLLYSAVIPYRDCTEPTLQGEQTVSACTSV